MFLLMSPFSNKYLCLIQFACELMLCLCHTLVLSAGCFDSAVRLRAGSLCGVLIMLIRHALHAFEKYGRDS